jgi:hypothetical protein
MEKTYEFSYSGIESVTIEGDLFDIDLTGESRDDVSGVIATSDDFVLRHRQNGSTLEIWHEIPLLKFWSSKKHSLTLLVPFSTAVKIQNSSGDAVVRNIKSGSLSIKTSSGDILAQDIEAVIDLTASSGKITASRLSSQSVVSAKTSSGDISMADAAASIKASSTSGKQLYERTSGGIDAKSSSGAIKGERVSIRDKSSFASTSGDISIALADPLEGFSFALSASSGKLGVGAEQARKKLLVGTGPIEITGISTSGNQTFALAD